VCFRFKDLCKKLEYDALTKCCLCVSVCACACARASVRDFNVVINSFITSFLRSYIAGRKNVISSQFLATREEQSLAGI
jgi:hypothetical protein